MTCLTLICLCYWCWPRCWHKRCPKFSKWCKHYNSCTTITLKPRIVNSIHPSKEIIRCSGSRASHKVRNSLTDDAEATELVSLNTNVRNTAPSGKFWKCTEGLYWAEILRVVLVLFNWPRLKFLIFNCINDEY